ncbi:MAG: hypothetical protein KAX37_10060, partial [Opitutaceae bacterium]|nr:hypothetical protein [Opitutaceae bacterium]
SSDGGRNWTPGAYIERGSNREFSYPFLVEDGAGSIHLTYTWQRKRIKHVQFNQAWLDGTSATQSASIAQ